jgi:hypothetical protein
VLEELEEDVCGGGGVRVGVGVGVGVVKGGGLHAGE